MKPLKEIEFVLLIDPPRTTEQEHRVGGRKANGQYIVYRDPKLINVMDTYFTELRPYVPESPFVGPVSLTVEWGFPNKVQKTWGSWKVTRPDTDNMIKLLKDCMTRSGFWRDDSQVCNETLRKKWSESGYIWIRIEAIE